MLRMTSLSGDRAREAAKQAAESLKNQVREKLGDGTTSSIANGIINALADTGDADTEAQRIMLLMRPWRWQPVLRVIVTAARP